VENGNSGNHLIDNRFKGVALQTSSEVLNIRRRLQILFFINTKRNTRSECRSANNFKPTFKFFITGSTIVASKFHGSYSTFHHFRHLQLSIYQAISQKLRRQSVRLMPQEHQIFTTRTSWGLLHMNQIVTFITLH